jgi:hypothetical protein
LIATFFASFGCTGWARPLTDTSPGRKYLSALSIEALGAGPTLTIQMP